MSWRDSLGPASFRGAKFFVETAERSGGRRGTLHQFPNRDTPYFDDLGRKARTFNVEGYVLGDDYFSVRDALLEALETAGPGELVHPYYGTRRVVVSGDFTARETREEGGLARFLIPFTESTAKAPAPTTTPDSSGAVRSSASAMRDSVTAEFLAKYVPGVYVDSLSASLRSASLMLDANAAAFTTDSQKLASLESQISTFNASVSSLVSTPSDLASNLTDLISAVGSSTSALLTLYSYNPGVRPPAGTSNRAQEQANFDAIQRLVQRLVVARAAELVLDETFASYEEAVTGRTAITDLLDDQADVAADDTYPALLQLRADLVKAVPGDGSDLPHLLSHTPIIALPSLVLAHRLYGDVSLEADVLARNDVRHPGFVPGGIPLEVLSRG